MRLGSVLLILTLPVLVVAQHSDWETLIEAANQFTKQGRYTEAERSYLGAIKEAERSEQKDLRLGRSLSSLAGLRSAQGRYEEARSLYRKAAGVLEAALGPEHVDLAIVRSGSAKVEMNMGHLAESEPLSLKSLAVL